MYNYAMSGQEIQAILDVPSIRATDLVSAGRLLAGKPAPQSRPSLETPPIPPDTSPSAGNPSHFGNTPDWQPWLLDFQRALQVQKRCLDEKINRERSAVALSDLAVKILDYARRQGRVTTHDMVREYGASPNTQRGTTGACAPTPCARTESAW